MRTPGAIVVGDQQQALAVWPVQRVGEQGQPGEMDRLAARKIDMRLGRRCASQPFALDIVADPVEGGAQVSFQTGLDRGEYNQSM